MTSLNLVRRPNPTILEYKTFTCYFLDGGVCCVKLGIYALRLLHSLQRWGRVVNPLSAKNSR